jgi:hypothetical protein
MQNSKGWHKSLTRELSQYWSEDNNWSKEVTPLKLVEIELGLYLVTKVLPTDSASSLWSLLTGYYFKLPQTQFWQEQECHMLHNARVVIPFFKNRRYWQRWLDLYLKIPERLRLFDLNQNSFEIISRQDKLSVCPNRLDLYEETLTKILPYTKDKLEWATTGRYVVPAGRRTLATVEVDAYLASQPATHPLPTHNLATSIKNRSKPLKELRVEWSALLETALWMDKREKMTLPAGTTLGNWYSRMERVRLEVFDETGLKLQVAEQLTIQGLLHLVGMVSSGKSTLMDVLAVWVAQHDKRVTLVLGDVISVLNKVQQFHRLGISVAPVLGSSNRERHTSRLHRVVQAENPAQPLYQQHQGFEWLSTTCPLDALRDTNRPFEAKPCLNLRSIRTDIAEKNSAEFIENSIAADDLDGNLSEVDYENNENLEEREKICPLYTVCPFHKAQRELITASVWIATPASLIYSRVAQPINQERIRFLELAYLKSDLIIVDEADLVQIQLDSAFSPSQTLISRGSQAWFNNLRERVVQQLSREGRKQLGQLEVNEWCQVHDTTHTAADRLYGMLLKDSVLRNWVGGHYFTSWGLFEKLAIELSGAPEGTSPNPAERTKYSSFAKLLTLFEEYLNDPLGESTLNPLAELSRQVITVSNGQMVQKRILAWLKANQTKMDLTLSDTELERAGIKLHFILILSVLGDRLEYLLQNWKQAEEALWLEGSSSLLFHRPPEDYMGVIPETPMSNLLGFQYLNFSNDKNTPGDLRFFRCNGVGRWILLHLHELFSAGGSFGPHVLLLSGTSWAGNSPSYHLQVTPGGVLKAPDQEIAAIRQSSFKFLPFYDNDQRPIKVSGLNGSRREEAIKQLLYQLGHTKNTSYNNLSELEVEKNKLAAGRQRILLLVGSYDEAVTARLYLEQLRPEWRGQVLNLIPDDEEFEGDWQTGPINVNPVFGNGASAVGERRNLKRGLLQQFASTGAWLLIAPLLAVERGHNILNEENVAAIGAAYFLVRPHPRPDDINHAVYSINQWAIDALSDTTRIIEATYTKNKRKRPSKVVPRNLAKLSYEEVAQRFRSQAFSHWIYLLQLPMIYSTLPVEERSAHIWSQLVVIWQVIGRLVRGGKSARIYFCDASFMRRAAEFSEKADVSASSLLTGIYHELKPYFTQNTTEKPVTKTDQPAKIITAKEQLLAQTLFSPLYEALQSMLGE